MILYLILTISTVVLAALVKNNRLFGQSQYKLHNELEISTRGKMTDRAVLIGIFLILSLVLVLRVNIGNDYGRYAQILHELRYDGYVITEPLFNFVCRFIMKNKFWWNYGYILCFAVLSVVTIAAFIKAFYDLSEWFFLTFYLFMMLGMYFQCFSTVRYYLALALGLYSVKYLLSEKYGRFVVLVLIAAGFHKSALVIFPIYLLAKVPWKKWHLFLGFGIGVQFLIFQDFYRGIMLKLYPSYERETQILEGGTSWVNIIRAVVVLIFSLIYYKSAIEGKKANRFWFHLNVGAVLLYVFCYYFPEISRIGYYLNISQIFLLASFVKAEENKRKRNILTGIILLAGLVYFIIFMKTVAGSSLAILPYQSWVFQEMDPIYIMEQ